MIIKAFRNISNEYGPFNEINTLRGFKKVNIFVGINNSGKSRFLRSMFKGKVDDFVINENYNAELKEIYELLQPKFGNAFYMTEIISLMDSDHGNYAGRYNKLVENVSSKINTAAMTGGITDLMVATGIKKEMETRNILKKISTEKNIYKKVYIPILRGLRHLDFENHENNKRDLYNDRIKMDHKFLSEDEVFSGLSIYVEIKKLLLGSKENRSFVKKFEQFLSENFFSNQSVTLIPDYESDILKINIGDKEDREIFNVGDGIQSIIINCFQAFKFYEENMVLFIEEPEMTMHPYIQRVLIDTFVTKFPKLQVFLTTHSNHFLDLTYDYPDEVSIFSFEGDSKGKFNIKNLDNQKFILDLLGIRNSSVFLSNSVIWTEGVTDRMLLRKLISLSLTKFKEDYHYTFSEYGGNNLKNFDFIDDKEIDSVRVQSLSKTNFIIADNDNLSDEENLKVNRRKKIQSVVGESNFFDNHIEIENLIPYNVWVDVVRRLLDLKKGKSIKLKSISDQNIEIEFNNDLKNEKIGIILKKYLIEINGRCGYYRYNDIRCLGEDKKDIMQIVIDTIEDKKLSLKDFPKITQQLINKILSFVEISNQ